MDQLLEILKREGRDIIEDFNAASQQGRGTPQEISDFREHAVQSFIARFYPRSHIVSKGKVTGLDGNQSNSVDCLILNPIHPNLIDSQGKFRLIFADGCDSAIEVKPDIARIDELHRALNQGVTVKKIIRSKTSILAPSRLSDRPELIAHSQYIPFFIFSLKSPAPEVLYNNLLDFYRDKATPLEHQVDGICTLNSGMLVNIKHVERNYYGANPPIGKNTGWYFEKWLELSLLGLLFHLEASPPSSPVITEPIMKRILKKIARFHIERIGDIIA